MTPKKAIVLPADIYDAWEFAALVFGGVGADYLTEEQRRAVERGERYTTPTIDQTPLCGYGYAGFLTGTTQTCGFWDGEVAQALRKAFWNPYYGETVINSNNAAVRAINKRKGKVGAALADRVSWREYTQELNIVRGSSLT